MQPPDVYSSHHRFFDVRGRGNLPRACGRQSPVKIQPPSPRGPRVSCGTSQRGPTGAGTTGARARMRSGRSRRLHSRSSSGSGIAFESSGAPCAGRRSAPGPLAGHPWRRYLERNERTVATCRCQVRGQVAPKIPGSVPPHPNGQRPESGRHADQGGVQPSVRGPALPGGQIHVFMVVASGSVGRRMRWARSPGGGGHGAVAEVGVEGDHEAGGAFVEAEDRSCSRSWPGVSGW
jgi:hypothetical protein